MVAVRRGLVAIAFFLVGSACAIGFLSATPSEAAPEGRAWTHRLASLTGEYVDRWTVNDPEPCGLVGEGTVTVKFRIAVTPRVALVYSRFAGAEPSGYGRWIIGVPSAHGPGLFDGPRRPATATIELVDSTVQRPPSPIKSVSRRRRRAAGPGRWGARRSASLATTVAFSKLISQRRSGPASGCGVGRTERFTDRFLTGGTREGDLLMRMPSVATVNRRRVLIVTGRLQADLVYGLRASRDLHG